MNHVLLIPKKVIRTHADLTPGALVTAEVALAGAVAHETAGPAVLFSFLIAGVASGR